MNVQAVIFDMDGVLFNTEARGVEMTIFAAEQLNIPITREAAINSVGLSGRACEDYYKRLYGFDIPYDEFSALWKRGMMEAAQRDGMDIKPGVVPLLSALRQKGIKTGIATSTGEITVKKYLELAGMSECFDALVCGDMVKNRKPDPETFLLAAKLLCVRPDLCIGIEDSSHGLHALRASGMISVFVPDLFEPDDEIMDCVDYCFDTIDKVITLIND